MENNIESLHCLIDERTKKLNNLKNGITNPGKEMDLLDNFLTGLGLEKNEQSRFAAYEKIANLKDNLLLNLFKIIDIKEDDKSDYLKKAFLFTASYHMSLHKKMIDTIEKNNLLSPFYLCLIKGSYDIGVAFNDFQLSWQEKLIDGVNKEITKQFNDDTEIVMKFLRENNLFDLGHDDTEADRSYSVLKKESGKYTKLSYIDFFPSEIGKIVDSISSLIKDLEKLEDTEYNQKEAYIKYLNAIKNAFEEKDTDNLVNKWAQVDIAWMSVNGPFQITHPLEYYEDKYRKAVAPEWDLRLQDNHLFESKVKSNMIKMFDELFDKIDKVKYKDIYDFSSSSLNNVQLYISSPMFYYGANFNGLVSAQVVPNDTVVSQKYGKKIYSFAKNVYEIGKNSPITKFTPTVFEEKLLKDYVNFVKGDEKTYYKVYDIKTIGHEFGHTLWLDTDTESLMNVNGNFKNIEEWKATTGGIISFFLNPDETIRKEVILDIVSRTINLTKRMEIDDVSPYYCERLIHMEILYKSKMISINKDNKIELNLNAQTSKNLEELYLENYETLIKTYINKENADNFLYKFITKEDGVFLPLRQELKDFVKYAYGVYNKVGNEIDNRY